MQAHAGALAVQLWHPSGAELAGYPIAAVCALGVLGERPANRKCVLRDERIDRAVGGEVLTIPAPADAYGQGLPGEGETHRAAQAATASLVHRFLRFESSESDDGIGHRVPKGGWR